MNTMKNMKTVLKSMSLLALSCSPLAGQASVYDLPKGLDSLQCNIEVSHRNSKLKLHNLMAQPGSLNKPLNLKPSQKDQKEITYSLPNRFTGTIGIETACLSLWVANPVFVDKKSAEERMLALGNGKYLDICWKQDTGVRSPEAEKKTDGYIMVYLAERSLEKTRAGEHLSMSAANIRLGDEIFVQGEQAKSRHLSGIGDVSVSCKYHTLTDEERENYSKSKMEELKKMLGSYGQEKKDTKAIDENSKEQKAATQVNQNKETIENVYSAE